MKEIQAKRHFTMMAFCGRLPYQLNSEPHGASTSERNSRRRNSHQLCNAEQSMTNAKYGNRRRDMYSVKKQDPITEESCCYPPNPLLSRTTLHLSQHEKFLVAFNRILLNYWKMESPFYDHSSVDWATQHARLLEATDSSCFPDELLQSKMPRSTKKQLLPMRFRPKTSTLLQKNQQGNEENENPMDNLEGEEPEEYNDFGGDDYAMDYFEEDQHDDFIGEDQHDDEMFLL